MPVNGKKFLNDAPFFIIMDDVFLICSEKFPQNYTETYDVWIFFI